MYPRGGRDARLNLQGFPAGSREGGLIRLEPERLPSLRTKPMVPRPPETLETGEKKREADERTGIIKNKDRLFITSDPFEHA